MGKSPIFTGFELINCTRSITFLIIIGTLLLLLVPPEIASSGSNDVDRGLNKEKSTFTSYCYEKCSLDGVEEHEHSDNPENVTIYREGNWSLYPNSKCGENSKSQSPIDIQSSQVWNLKNPTKIDWRFFHHYNMYHDKTVVFNDGILFLIDSKALNHILSFSVHYGEEEEDVAIYYLSNVHIHWGKDPHQGSEHAIDGKKYAAEVHLVHTKEGVTLENYKNPLSGRLSSKHDNIFIISVLLEQGERSQNFDPIENVLSSKINPLAHVPMGRQFSMFALISKLLARGNSVYYSYHGSLTAPTCDEIVTWAVFKDPLQVSKKQLDALRNNIVVQHHDHETNLTEAIPVANNFRSLQKANGRNITAYIPHAVFIGARPGRFKENTSTPGMPINIYIVMSILLMLILANNI